VKQVLLLQLFVLRWVEDVVHVIARVVHRHRHVDRLAAIRQVVQLDYSTDYLLTQTQHNRKTIQIASFESQ